MRASHDDRAGNQERLDPHVVQTGDRAGGVVRVQRAQHLVTGQRRFDGDVGRFVVTNFTDHHDVRVLTEDGAERGSEIEPDFVAHRDLVDAGQLVLDRVLDRHDVVLRVVQLLEHGVERGRLAGTGRAGDENHSVRRVDRLLEFVERVLRPCPSGRCCR